MALSVVTTNSGVQTSASGSHSVSLPSGVTSGDLLVVALTCAGAPTVTWPVSPAWTEIGQYSNGTSCTISIGYRIANGTDSCTISTGSNVRSSHCSYRITGHDSGTAPEVGAAATASSAAPDSPSLTPSWGSAETLFIAAYGWLTNSGRDQTAYPTNYTLGQVVTSAYHSAGTCTSMSGRLVTGTSEDPGTGTLAGAEAWVAQTIGVKPASSGLNFTHTGNVSGTEYLSTSRTISKFYTGGVNGVGTLASGRTISKFYTGSIAGEVTIASPRTISKFYSGAIAGELSVSAGRTVDKFYAGGVSGELSISASRAIEKMFSGDISGELSLAAARTIEKFFTGNVVGELTFAAGQSFESGSGLLNYTWAGAVSGELTLAAQRTIEKIITGRVSGELYVVSGRTVERVFSGDISGELSTAASYSKWHEHTHVGGISGELSAATRRTIEKMFAGQTSGTLYVAAAYDSDLVTIWVLANKPSVTWTSLGLPALDGVITDPAQDGAYTELGTDGAQTEPGWSLVAKPSSSWTTINKP